MSKKSAIKRIRKNYTAKLASLQKRVVRVPWKRVSITTAISAVLIMVIIQFFYPVNKVMFGAQVDGIDVGGLEHDEATEKINKIYHQRKMQINFGSATEPYSTPSLDTLGVVVDANAAVDSVLYPWWLRLVPTSIWWGSHVLSDSEVKVSLNQEKVSEYVSKELGESCQVDPKNASITVQDNQLKLDPAVDGGHCELQDVTRAINQAKLVGVAEPSVRIALVTIPPEVSDSQAQELLDQLSKNLKSDVALNYGDKQFTVKANTVKKWLKFSVKKDQLIPSIDNKKASKPLHKLLDEAVARSPGVLTIKTHDFQIVSQTGGGNGQQLNVAGTTKQLMAFLQDKQDDVSVETSVIPPIKKYIRSYSPTDAGLSALMKNYANDHAGVYGVSLIELSGKRRRAEYQGSKNFFPASTYKVFIAYSVLKRVESGQFKWSMEVTGGRNLDRCFNDMLVFSDNPCPEKLTTMIGVSALNQDLANLGLSHSRFVGPMKHRTTANDLSTFMAGLESGQIGLTSAHRTKFIDALKRDVYRKGIPAGAKGTVANKVGFINGLLHDTAIVYSPSGTYVLTIMTDGSSWNNIAELTRQLENLRTK